MSTLPIPSSVKQIYKQTKNTVLQVPEIERKVKEATSNEKWGPTSTQMREIAQATFSYHDLPIIMGAIFRRLNDHGKYWRHVYKSLLLIDYLLRNGSEQVIRECREHVVAIQTLNEFQYIDERDQDVGLSVRERAKLIVEILHDEKRLKVEREKAKNTAKKFMVGIGSEGSSGGGYGNDSYGYDNGGRGGYSANNDYDNSSSSSNTRYRDDDEEEDRYDSSSSNTKRYEEDSPSNYSNSTNNVSSSSRSGGNRPRAASGERPSSSSSSTSGNVSSASSSGNRGATTGNLFSIDDVLTNTPTPQQSNSRHQEIDFFNTPSNNFNPFPNNTNNAFPPSNNFNNNTNNGFPPVNNNNNTNTGFPPSNSFDNNNAFQSSTSQDNWASFDNNNASSSSASTTTATTSENEKKEFDPWARADLFNLGGLKEGKQSGSGGNISSSASKTPMGALPGQKGNTNTPNFNTGGMGTGTGPSVTMGSMNNNMGGYNMGGPNMGMNMGGPNMGMNMGGPNMGMNMGGPNMGMNMGGPNMGGPNMGMNMGGQNMGYGANANMGYGNRPQSGFGGPMNMGNPQFQQQQQQQQPGLQRGPSFTQQQPNNNSWNF